MKVGGANFSDILAGTITAFEGSPDATEISKNSDILRTFLAKSPVDPSMDPNDDVNATYKIGGETIGYQLAAALEVVGADSKLGAYSTDRVNAITVGNFVPAATSVATNGAVTTSRTGASLDKYSFGKINSIIAAGSEITDFTATRGLNTIVIDGSTNLPY